MPAIRVFFWENGDVRRVPLTVFDRVHDAKGRMPEYAGKKVRYAMVVLDTEDRKPVGVSFVNFGILHFDQEGELDQAAMFEGDRLIAEAVAYSIGLEKDGGPVIRAVGRFAKKEYADRFKWKPSDEELDALKAALWKGRR